MLFWNYRGKFLGLLLLVCYSLRSDGRRVFRGISSRQAKIGDEHFASILSSQRKQDTISQCGKLADELGDSFGLIGQFSSLKTGSLFGVHGEQSKFQLQDRIIGGTLATTPKICWQVFIVGTTPNNSRQTCGGVIIGNRKVLTAAHCLLADDTRIPLAATSFEVVVGALNNKAPGSNSQDSTGCAQTFKVSTMLIHPNYDDNVNDNDLGILILSTAIDIRKPCACTLCLQPRQPSVGETCMISGYGLQTSDPIESPTPIPLKWITHKIVNQSDAITCPVFSHPITGVHTNTDLFLCAAGNVGEDPCMGDDGDPMACYDPVTRSYYLAGIYSLGSEKCGRGLGMQTVKVAAYLQWIRDSDSFEDSGNQLVDDATAIAALPTIAPAQTSSEKRRCGSPTNGGIDPFGIVHQNHNRGRFLTAAEVHRAKLMPRIVGGAATTATELCWQAFVLTSSGSLETTCGGTIIGAQTILTAASCLVDASGKILPAVSFTVTVGASNIATSALKSKEAAECAETFRVQKVGLHHAYQVTTNDNDVGVLTLSKPIDLRNKDCVCTLCLEDLVPVGGEICIMSGFGQETAEASERRSSLPLKWVKQKVVAQTSSDTGNCSLFSDPKTGVLTNVNNFICTYGLVGQDQCLGDSGGALTCYNSAQKSYYLAGIVSIGSAVCGDGNGGQSVKIAKYLQWIKDNTVPGDVVTPANGATLPVGGGTGDISVSLFIPSLPSASEATVSSVASTAGSVEPLSGTCGVPGDGTVDPFGLASQFRFGLFRKKLAVHPNAIGGEVIPPTTVCWQAVLVLNAESASEGYCGGTVIGSRTVLTAAHCLVDEKGIMRNTTEMLVIIGTTSFSYSSDNVDTSGCAQYFKVSTAIPNEAFNYANEDNDIGMVILNTSISFSSNNGCHCSICLSDRQPAVGESCAVSGYGDLTTSDATEPVIRPLSWVIQTVFPQSNSTCTGSVLIDPDTGDTTDVGDFICAASSTGGDSCQGDSGGPFVCYDPTTSSYYVAGLVAYGPPCGTPRGSQYTKVAHYLNWISINAPDGDVSITSSSTSTTVMTFSPSSATVAATNGTLSTTSGTSKPTTFYPEYNFDRWGFGK